MNRDKQRFRYKKMLFIEVSGNYLPTPPCLHRHDGQKSIFMIQDQYVAPGQLPWYWDGCQAHGCSFLRTGRWEHRCGRRRGMDSPKQPFPGLPSRRWL